MSTTTDKQVTLGVSPKLIGSVAGAVLGYLATQVLVDFPSGVDLAIQAGLVGLGAFAAPVGNVVAKARRR